MTDDDILRLSPRDLSRSGDLRSIEVAGVSIERWIANSAEFVLCGAEILLRLAFIGLHSPRNGLACVANKKEWREPSLVPVLLFRRAVYIEGRLLCGLPVFQRSFLD
jgi:hypothetical protein